MPFDLPISLEYLCRNMAFNPSHQFRWRYRRRSRHQNVYLILTHYTPDNLNLKPFACLTNHFSNSIDQISAQHMVTILRHPYKIILDLVFGMTAMTVFHALSIIQLLAESYPSKDGGLNLGKDE